MEASAMGRLRAGVLIALLGGLPVAAVIQSPAKIVSWAAALSPIAAANGQADRLVASATTVPVNVPPTSDAASAFPPAHRERASGERVPFQPSQLSSSDPAESANARVLRRPIYRPMADEAQLATIRRVPADQASEDSRRLDDQRRIEALEAELRQWGAAEYRLDRDAAGQYHFRGIFDSPVEAAPPQLFQATAASRCQAMEQVLVQVQAWRGEARSGQHERFDMR